MKKIIQISLMFMFAFEAISQENPKQKEVKTTMTRDRDKILKEVLLNDQFLKSCEIILRSNEQITFKAAKIEQKENKYAVSWSVLGANKTNSAEYSKLVYDFDGKKFIVYFEEKNKNFASKSLKISSLKIKFPPSWWPWGGSSGGNGGIGGGWSSGGGFCGWNWSNWLATPIECKYSYTCFFKFQHASFITETRFCNSNRNITQARVIKLYCGC